jgi:hypothetical protein
MLLPSYITCDTVVHMENWLCSFVTHVLHENISFILLEGIKAVLHTIPQGDALVMNMCM